MEPGCQEKRQVNSGFTCQSKRNWSKGLLSSSVHPAKRTVWPEFTYSALRPVSGCVRTTGCSAMKLDLSVPSLFILSSRVFEASALVEEFTAFRVSNIFFKPEERESKARYIFANKVSPPKGGTSRASSIEAI